MNRFLKIGLVFAALIAGWAALIAWLIRSGREHCETGCDHIGGGDE